MPRFSGGKVSTSIDCSTAASPPPPAPCSTRAMIRNGRVCAIPHRPEAIVNSATEIM